MPSYTVTYGDDRPSRPSSKFANPAHGIMGVLGTSGSDPRERGRKRSRQEIEAASRAAYLAKKEHLAKVKGMRDTEKSAEAEKKTSAARAKILARPDVQEQIDAKEGNRLQQEARKVKKVERLTPEQSLAKGQSEKRQRDAVERERIKALPSTVMSELMAERKPEDSGLMASLNKQNTINDWLGTSGPDLRPEQYPAQYDRDAEPAAPAAPVKPTAGPKFSTLRDGPEYKANINRALLAGQVPDDPSFRGTRMEGRGVVGGPGYNRDSPVPPSQQAISNLMADQMIPVGFNQRYANVSPGRNLAHKLNDIKIMARREKVAADEAANQQANAPAAHAATRAALAQEVANTFSPPAPAPHPSTISKLYTKPLEVSTDQNSNRINRFEGDSPEQRRGVEEELMNPGGRVRPVATAQEPRAYQPVTDYFANLFGDDYGSGPQEENLGTSQADPEIFGPPAPQPEAEIFGPPAPEPEAEVFGPPAPKQQPVGPRDVRRYGRFKIKRRR